MKIKGKIMQRNNELNISRLKNIKLDEVLINKIKNYFNHCDDDEKERLNNAIINNEKDKLEKWFSNDLEFGTGGLRGIMDIGYSFFNSYTVSRASIATVKYFQSKYKDEEKKICISYDTRINSEKFAKIAAIIASKHGFNVYFAKLPYPTPFLSYYIAKTKSICGIMITASHNPPIYNGFKVYDETGCQILPKDAKQIIKEYLDNENFEKIEISEFEDLIKKENFIFIEQNELKDFVEDIYEDSLLKDFAKNAKLLNIVYSSLHGTGINVFKHIEKKLNLNVKYVESQIIMDGKFPNAKSINPENRQSFDESINLAIKNNADLIILTDPDADRLGLAFKDKDGYFIPSGNEIAIMLLYFLCLQLRFEEINYQGVSSTNFNYYAVTTIVTTDLFELIGRYFGIEVIKTLTGFKYIGDIINKTKNKKFLFAAEESNGYLVSEKAKDKDAFSTILLALEFAVYLTSKKIYAKDFLNSIYGQFGYYLNELVNLDLGDESKSSDEIMKIFRENPIEIIADKKVRKIIDYIDGYEHYPKSDILQYIGENFKITIRPSGTEPKLKIYFQVVSHSESQSKELLETFKNYFINLIKVNEKNI